MKRCVVMRGVVTKEEFVGRTIGLVIVVGTFSRMLYEILWLLLR